MDKFGGEDDVVEGVLVSLKSKHVYAISTGIPIMLDDGLPDEFVRRFSAQIKKVAPGPGSPRVREERRWSFSDQWSAEEDLGVDRTWGYGVDTRVQLMPIETDRAPEWFAGKTVLDAGCGNGQLTDRMTELGVEAVGIDFSESVMRANRRRRSPNVDFVRGDLQMPPFAPESFDLIVSNGVLHHTPNTQRAFDQVARCVKGGGSFYVWLYSRPEGFVRRYLWLGSIDVARWFASRAPAFLSHAFAKGAAYAARAKYRIAGQNSDLSIEELTVGIIDSITPRWRHYHTPTEVASWFAKQGFDAPKVTHWDNPYGFGVVAVKKPYAEKPSTEVLPLNDSSLRPVHLAAQPVLPVPDPFTESVAE